MNFKDILNRLKHPGTIIALVSLVTLILSTNGVNLNNDKIITTTKALCSIGIILGALNEPTTAGLDLPFIPKKDNTNTK